MPLITNTIIATVTGYCACTNCCGPHAKGITANGHKAKAGLTIAAPRSLPFGTKVTINSRTYTVEDRLAKRFDSRFDIFFNSHQEALQFGKKKVKVTIIQQKKG